MLKLTDTCCSVSGRSKCHLGWTQVRISRANLNDAFFDKKTHGRVNLTLKRLPILHRKVQLDWFQVDDHSCHLWSVLDADDLFHVLENRCANNGLAVLYRTLQVLLRVEHVEDRLAVLLSLKRLLLVDDMLARTGHHAEVLLRLCLLNGTEVLVTILQWSLALLARRSSYLHLLLLLQVLRGNLLLSWRSSSVRLIWVQLTNKHAQRSDEGNEVWVLGAHVPCLVSFEVFLVHPLFLSQLARFFWLTEVCIKEAAIERMLCATNFGHASWLSVLEGDKSALSFTHNFDSMNLSECLEKFSEVFLSCRWVHVFDNQVQELHWLLKLISLLLDL